MCMEISKSFQERIEEIDRPKLEHIQYYREILPRHYAITRDSVILRLISIKEPMKPTKFQTTRITA